MKVYHSNWSLENLFVNMSAQLKTCVFMQNKDISKWPQSFQSIISTCAFLFYVHFLHSTFFWYKFTSLSVFMYKLILKFVWYSFKTEQTQSVFQKTNIVLLYIKYIIEAFALKIVNGHKLCEAPVDVKHALRKKGLKETLEQFLDPCSCSSPCILLYFRCWFSLKFTIYQILTLGLWVGLLSYDFLSTQEEV